MLVVKLEKSSTKINNPVPGHILKHLDITTVSRGILAYSVSRTEYGTLHKIISEAGVGLVIAKAFETKDGHITADEAIINDDLLEMALYNRMKGREA